MRVADFLDHQRDHLNPETFEFLGGFLDDAAIKGVALPENFVNVQLADDGAQVADKDVVDEPFDYLVGLAQEGHGGVVQVLGCRGDLAGGDPLDVDLDVVTVGDVVLGNLCLKRRGREQLQLFDDGQQQRAATGHDSEAADFLFHVGGIHPSVFAPVKNADRIGWNLLVAAGHHANDNDERHRDHDDQQRQRPRLDRVRQKAKQWDEVHGLNSVRCAFCLGLGNFNLLFPQSDDCPWCERHARADLLRWACRPANWPSR